MAVEGSIGRAEDAVSVTAGKSVVHSAIESGSADTAVSGVAGAGGAAAALGNIFGVVGVTVAAAASLVINQISYHHRINEMLDTYRDEIGAQLRKPASKVNERDLELIAKGDAKHGIPANKTIADGLSRIKTKRNIGMVVTTASILGTLAILAVTGIGALPMLGTGSFLAATGTLLAKAAIGYGIHSVLEKPMHWAAKKIFGVEDNTSDHIADLRKQHKDGKAISREQVVGVFVSANKELSAFVRGQFGKDYDDLSVQQKRSITDAFEQNMLPVTAITDSINSGRVKISELAFAVEGKSSGVEPGSAQEEPGLFGKIRKAHTPPKRAVVEYNNPTPERSFVSRLEEQRATGPRTLH